MIINRSKLLGFPILSLRASVPIAWTKSEIIDPNDLKIVAFSVIGPETGNGSNGDILETDSIREMSGIGMIIDDISELVTQDEVIKLDDIMKLNFELTGLKVKTKKGTHLGKVIDYTVDLETFKLVQLIVARPALKALIDPELVISRSEIVEVSDYEIIVKDEEEKIRKKAAKTDFVPNFVNPFRESTANQYVDSNKKDLKESE